MPDRKAKPVKRPKSAVVNAASRQYLDVLRVHGRVKEGDDCAASALPPGVTHVLVEQPDGSAPLLIEKRKSFF